MTVSLNTVNQYYNAIFRSLPVPNASFFTQMSSDAEVLNTMLSYAESTVDPIIRLYQTAFNRLPDPTGLTGWTTAYMNTPQAQQPAMLQSILNGFVNSIEFTTLYPANMNNTLFVTALYSNILNRAPDAASLAIYVAGLNNGTMTRAQILYAFSESTEFVAKMSNPIDIWLTRLAETPIANQNDIALYAGSLYDVTVDTVSLTENRDHVVVTGIHLNAVEGILGSTDKTSTDVGTFTDGDVIEGNGLTRLDLRLSDGFTGGDAPYVTMSGVNQININSASSHSVTLDASTYGNDISLVTVYGTKAGEIAIQNLKTVGQFDLASSAGFKGDIIIGNANFDNSGRADLAEPDTLAGQSAQTYTSNAMSSTLYSANGVKANMYIDGSSSGGGSSINLMTNEIQLNAGSGRAASGFGNGDHAGVHVFHYINQTEDLITAANIAVGTVDINIAKAAFGEVVLSNWANKTSDIGDAQALGVNVGAVTIDMADQGESMFEVRNIASNSTVGDTGSANPNAYASNITIGSIVANGSSNSELHIKGLQLAALSADMSSATGNAQAGNITVGTITATGVKAGDASVEFVNKVELTGTSISSADYGVTVGNLTVGAVNVSGWNDISLSFENGASFGGIGATADSGRDAVAIIGNTSIGNVTANGDGSVDLYVGDGNLSGTAQGDITLGTMSIGNVNINAGTSATFDVVRHAYSVDGDATIGATTIAANRAVGSVNLTAGSSASMSVDIAAQASGTGNATVGAVTIGNVVLAGVAAYATFDVKALASTAATAHVNDVTIGNITSFGSVTSSTGSANNAEINISIGAGRPSGSFTSANTPLVAQVDDVTIGNLHAHIVDTAASASVDAFINVDIHAIGGEASIGAVTVGDVSATANDGVEVNVNVLAQGYTGLATVGDVTIGDITVVNTSGNTDQLTFDASVSVLVGAVASATTGAAEASLGQVDIGDISITAGGGTNSPDATLGLTVGAQANGGTDGFAMVDGVVIGDITLSALGMTASSSTGDAAANGSLRVVAGVSGSGDATVANVDIGAIRFIAASDADLLLQVSANVTGNGDGTISGVTIGGINLDAGTNASLTLSVNVAVSGSGDATISDVTIGDLTLLAHKTGYVETFDVRVVADVENKGDASISSLTIGDISAKAYQDYATFDLEIAARAGNSTTRTGDGTLSDVTIGDVTITSTTDDARAQMLAQVSIWKGDSVLNGFEIGNISLNGDATASLDLVVSANVSTGDATVSDITIGDITASAKSSTAGNVLDVAGLVYNSGDASLSNITIGNVTVESNLDEAHNYVTARGISVGGTASVSDVTIGDVTAGVIGTTATSATFTGHEVNVGVGVFSLGSSGASISTVEIGDIGGTAAFSNDVTAQVYVLAGAVTAVTSATVSSVVGAKGEASISDVTIGDVYALAQGTYSDSMSLGAASIDLRITATASMTSGMTSGGASISNVSIGMLEAVGSQVDITSHIYAYVSNSGSADVSATVSDVSIEGISATVIGGTGNTNKLEIYTYAYSEPGVGVIGQAMIENVTIGDIDFDSSASNGGRQEIYVGVTTTAESRADIQNVSVGDINMTIGDGSHLDLWVHYAANIGASGANEGDIISGSIGNVSIVTGASATDNSGYTNGIIVEALDDIRSFTIGDWSIDAGAGSILNNHHIQVLAGNSNSFVGTLTIGDVDLALAGGNGSLSSNITVSSDYLIRSVTVGNVGVHSTGVGVVSHAINVSATASSGDVNAVTIGDVSIDTASAGAAHITLNVDAGDYAGLVTVGDVDLTGVGALSSGTFKVTIDASSADGLTVGDISFTTDGVVGVAMTTTLNVTIDVSASNGAGSVTIGDVTANAKGSYSGAVLDITTHGGVTGDVSIGNFDISMSNNVSASRDAYFTLNVDAAGTASIGDITLTSLAPDGRMNSAGVFATLTVAAADDVTIGNIDVTGGLYADSGVNDVAADSFSGTFAGNYHAAGTSSTQDIDFAADMLITFEYVQPFTGAGGAWELAAADAISFIPGNFTDFAVTYSATNDVWLLKDTTYNTSSTASTAGLMATISFDGTTLSIDWADGSGDTVDMEALGFVDASVDLTFDGTNGLMNDGDKVTLSLGNHAINTDNVSYDPTDLVVLDNFQNLIISSASSTLDSWLNVTSGGDITIGNIDYSNYEALASGDGPVVIDISGTTYGAHTIKTAQGATELTDNSDYNAITLESSEDDTVTFVEQANSTAGEIDSVSGFETGSDELIFTASGIGTKTLVTNDGNYATFLTNAAVVEGSTNLYISQFGGNTYVAYDADGTGADYGLNVVKLVGITGLSTSDFGSTGTNWTLS